VITLGLVEFHYCFCFLSAFVAVLYHAGPTTAMVNKDIDVDNSRNKQRCR